MVQSFQTLFENGSIWGNLQNINESIINDSDLIPPDPELHINCWTETPHPSIMSTKSSGLVIVADDYIGNRIVITQTIGRAHV